MMPIDEQDAENGLYRQMEMLERIEGALEAGGEMAAREEIDKCKKEITRRMEQRPIVPGL